MFCVIPIDIPSGYFNGKSGIDSAFSMIIVGAHRDDGPLHYTEVWMSTVKKKGEGTTLSQAAM